MKTYLTEVVDKAYANDIRIKANSFKEAEQKCPKGYRIIGELIEEINVSEFETLNMN